MEVNIDFLFWIFAQTAFMDLVDVFAVPADAPPIDSRWNNTSSRAVTGVGGTDPWDSPGET